MTIRINPTMQLLQACEAAHSDIENFLGVDPHDIWTMHNAITRRRGTTLPTLAAALGREQ